MKPFRFFALQLLCILGWLVTLGGCGFVILDGENMMMAIQGWMDEDSWVEVEL